MSPIRRRDFIDDLEQMPGLVDSWRALALQRVARCLEVQANAWAFEGVFAHVTEDHGFVEETNNTLGLFERATMQVLDQRYGIEAVRRLNDDLTVFTGYATDETSRAVAGAEVSILRADTGEVLFSGTADENGHYIVDGSRAKIEAVVAAGVGITELIKHDSLEQPVRTNLPSDRIDTSLTALDRTRIVAGPTSVVRPAKPSRPSEPVGPTRPVDVTPSRPDPVVREVRDLRKVSGIGPRRRSLLAEAGIRDLTALAAADAARVGEIAGVSAEVAKVWVKDAKGLLRRRPG